MVKVMIRVLVGSGPLEDQGWGSDLGGIRSLFEVLGIVDVGAHHAHVLLHLVVAVLYDART